MEDEVDEDDDDDEVSEEPWLLEFPYEFVLPFAFGLASFHLRIDLRIVVIAVSFSGSAEGGL